MRSHIPFAVLAALAFAPLSAPAQAEAPAAEAARAEPAPADQARPTTLDLVRKQGFVQCGSVSRPGLATVDGKGDWSGLEVEICRAIATAVLGDAARYAYHRYESDVDFDVARRGEDQVSFLSFAEMARRKLTDALAPGPTVFVESHDLLVADGSPARHPSDLAGKGICFIIGTPEENSLETWYHEHKIDIVPNAYQEDGEMVDTYNVQRCQAVTGEATALAAMRLDSGVNRLRSRFLPDHLLAFPILATTPAKGDAQWAAIVAWTIDTLLNADAKETDYRANGLRAMAVPGPALGLPAGWQKTVVDRVGSYSAIFRRTLGDGSPLKLDPGLNRTLADGGILLAPFRN